MPADPNIICAACQVSLVVAKVSYHLRSKIKEDKTVPPLSVTSGLTLLLLGCLMAQVRSSLWCLSSKVTLLYYEFFYPDLEGRLSRANFPSTYFKCILNPLGKSKF